MKIRELFQDYRDLYLEHAALNPERALHAWKHLGPIFGPMDAERLPAGAVARYTTSRQASPGTINRELGVLAAALRWGAANGYTSVVPHISKMRSPPPRSRVLDEGEIVQLLKAAEPWPHVLLYIKLALLTGQRKEAILDLRWENINGDVIDFASPYLRGAGRRKGRAVLPVSKELRQVLDEAQDRQTRSSSTSGHGWVVCDTVGYRCRSFRRAWAKVVEAAGLADTSVTPHTLRHTAATRLLHKGGSLVEAARFLGHRSTRTTEETYVKWQPDYLKGAVEMVGLP